MRNKVKYIHAFLYFLVSCAAVLLFIGHALAQDSKAKIYIDKATREKGYTFFFAQNNFSLALPPRSLRINAVFTAETYLDADKTLSAKIPEYYELASSIYQYDFGDVYPKDFKDGIIVSIQAQDNSSVLAFYDRTNEQWKIVPTSYSPQGMAFARIRLAYAHIALLKEKPWRANSHVFPALIPARAVYVVDETSRRYVGKAIHQQLSIASITKLMTALVFLDNNPGWDTQVSIRPSDDVGTSKVNFRNGEKIKIRDLFESMLVGSKNNSAKALARATGLSANEFVRRMNSKAAELGLRRTHFTDTTGLGAGNISTAAEVAALSRFAFGKKNIQRATMKAKYSFQAQNTRRWFTVRTTNALLGNGVYLTAAKTGFINESGYNFVAETLNKGKRLFVVILGARDNDSRFTLASELIRFVQEKTSLY